MAEPKLRIGIVFDDTLDRPDGVQQYVMTLGRWLIAQGHEVRFLVGNTEKPSEFTPFIRPLARNLSVRANANRMSTPLPASKRRIRQVLAAEQLDVLHVQMPYSPLMAGRVIQAASSQTAVVGTFHIVADGQLEQFGSKLLAAWARRTLKRFNLIMSVSDAARAFADQYFGIGSRVIPNMVEVARFLPAKKPKPTREKRLVFLGRLVERKGAQHLIDALAALPAKELEGWQVIIAGDGPLRSQLEAQAKQAGLPVEFRGFIDESVKAELLGSAEIAVFPSTGNESFGIVLIEAMAAGKAVVMGGDNAGYRYVLGPRGPHLLFDPRDTAQFADRLRMIMHDPFLRNHHRAWQKRRLRDFDIETVGPKIVDVYREALRQARKPTILGHKR